MEFFTKDATCPIILVTSSIPGEGKTFTAINLASAYSLAGKKTLLIGFALRRPNLSESFGFSRKIGLSTFLIGRNSLEEVVLNTDYPNLYVLPCGPVPPNPGELSSSEKAKKMFQSLKKSYDYIIVDSAPIGTVSDSYSIAAISDATLIMVRHGKTNKSYLGATLTELQTNGIDDISILVTGVKSNISSYRYAYKYEYKNLVSKI